MSPSDYPGAARDYFLTQTVVSHVRNYCLSFDNVGVLVNMRKSRATAP